MNADLSSYTREQLERKLLHMVSFIAYKLASEYIELTEPEAKVIRTAEAELENTNRILEHMVCVFPAWDVLEKTHPGYEIMKDWIESNHRQTLVRPCVCDGCKVDEREIKA